MNNNLTTAIDQMYRTVRQEQAAIQERTLSTFDDKISAAIATASNKAVDEARSDKKGVSFSVVTAPTGGGKTNNSIAYAVARRRVDPNFTAAFIVKTVVQCDEVFQGIIKMVGPESEQDIVVWSSGHDAKAKSVAAVQRVKDDYGIINSPKFDAVQLKSAPIVIVTHNKWLYKMERDIDNGVRRCNGQLRDLVYIDENPDIVSLVERTPSDVGKLKDFVVQVNPEHPWVSQRRAIQRRMEGVFDTNDGDTYVSAKIVSTEEALLLSSGLLRELFANSTGALSRGDKESLKGTVEFLRACADGYAFFTRQAPRSFVAYVTTYRPAPGYVLLDATADLSGLTLLGSGMDKIEVPTVDYSNLKIRQLTPPTAFQNIRTVTSTIGKARPYVDWMRQQVLAATESGDDVLIVLHKRLLVDFALIRGEASTEEVVNWDGRRIHSIHWGTGVGSNKYKSCRHVFLFGEFYRPRRVTAGQTLGLQGMKSSDADLSQLQGRKMSGHFLTIAEGELLRWSKQLACRGNVRKIDAQGRCGEMTLHTSMDLTRLVENADRLFPGASLPEVVSSEERSLISDLIALLTSSDTSLELSFAEIETLSEVPAGKLRAKLGSKRVAPIVSAYGWSIVSARSIGKPGKGKYLVKQPVVQSAA